MNNCDVIKLLLQDKKLEHDVIWLSIHNKYPNVKIRDYLTLHFALNRIEVSMDDVKDMANIMSDTVLVVSNGKE